MSNNKKKALGRGLSALLQDNKVEKKKPADKKEGGNAPVKKFKNKAFSNVLEIPIAQIQTNPYQPRTIFDEERLQELGQSIKELGVIQPITVRKIDMNTYQLISGERRLRASQMIGKESIPAFVRTANDKEMLEMAIVENIQRQELDPIEIALSYKRLLDECKQTQEQISERLGKKRSTITNALRLLQLQPLIQAGLRDHIISPGHAKALLGINNEKHQSLLYKEIIKKALSVRQTEEMVKEFKKDTSVNKTLPKVPKKGAELSKKWKNESSELGAHFGTKTAISFNDKGSGKISINFVSEEDLKRILELIDKK